MRTTIILLLLLSTTLFSQNKNEATPVVYPEGIYQRIGDFTHKTPTSITEFKKKPIKGGSAYKLYDSKTGKKIKKVFAVSDGKNLYIHISMILRYCDNSLNGQSPDGKNYFLKASQIGKYIYVEDYFSSVGATVAFGLTGALASRKLKSIIFQEDKTSFHLFKNFKKFKEFINENHPEIDAAALDSEAVQYYADHRKIKAVLAIIK